MSFWIFLEDVNSIGSGIHITWQNHLQITVYYSTKLIGICFPQEYYSRKFSNSDIQQKMNNMKDKHYSYKENDELLNDDEEFYGNWIYVLCSVSNYDEHFFIVGNNVPQEITTLNKEILYKIGENDYKYSEYPMKYFMSSTTSLTTELRLENLKKNDKIFHYFFIKKYR